MSLQTVKIMPKYGLIASKGKSISNPMKKPKPSIFAADDALEADDDEDESNQIGKVQADKHQKLEIQRVNKQIMESASRIAVDTAKLYQEALDTDASVFDYDGAYDSFKRQEVKPGATAEPTAPKSKYVANLQAMAKVRDIEHDRIFERKLLKERAAEDALFPDKPQFMTSAYKAKLEKEMKWEAEDKLVEEIEKKTDVRASGMHGFYANLLSKNVSMGGDVSNALSAYTTGSNRQSNLLQDPASQSQQVNVEGDNSANALNDATETTVKQQVGNVSAEGENNSSSALGKRIRDDEAPAKDANDSKLVSEIPVVDRETKIMSARERYLARKSQA